MSADAETPVASPQHGRLKLALKLILLVVLAGFWYVYVRRYWDDLRAAEWSIPWLACIAAGGVALAGYIVRGLLWSPLCHEITGHRLGWWRAVRVTATAWMGRYVPGKIWSLAGKAFLSAPDRSRLAPAAVAVSVDTFLSEGCGVLLAVTLPWLHPSARLHSGYALVISAVLVLFGIAACHPRVFGPVVNGVLRVARQAPLQRVPRFGMLLKILGANVLAFLFWGASLTILVMAVAGVSATDYPIITALFATAWVSGFIALIAPAGLGVRDSIMVIGLQELLDVPPAQAVLIMLLSRVVTTLVEVLLFAAVTLAPSAPTAAESEPSS